MHVCRYDRIEQQREQVSQRRAELGLILESQVKDPNTKAGERRTAAGLLASAVSKAWAHQQLLDAHSAQLRQQQEALSRPQNAGTALRKNTKSYAAGCRKGSLSATSSLQ